MLWFAGISLLQSLGNDGRRTHTFALRMRLHPANEDFEDMADRDACGAGVTEPVYRISTLGGVRYTVDIASTKRKICEIDEVVALRREAQIEKLATAKATSLAILRRSCQ